MMKVKTLRLFNGGRGRGDYLYIAAYSVQDAARLMAAAERVRRGKDYKTVALDLGRNAREIKEYFAECWGDSMKDVVPERGVWYAPAIEGGKEGKPERVDIGEHEKEN